ncbi:MAG: DUF58 domain-containing protein [Candidatus Omnitrophica bacterium]|nr:DUF58 domain-containing protein [Candidatus Omnitrophota bacterium]
MTARIHPTLDDLVSLQYQARNFSLLPRQPISSLLSGRHGSRLRGRGLSFEELRDYRPGDDIRTIDWRATARLRKPYVRVYNEERDRPVLFLVDQRKSMFFGSARTTKATAAAECAALGAWRALDGGDRIGAIIFNDEECLQIRPQRSRETVLRMCHELVRMNQGLKATGADLRIEALNDALRRAVEVAVHDYLVVLITDYTGDNETTQELVTTLAAHNDVIAVLVYDPFGIRMPKGTEIDISDGVERIRVPARAGYTDRFEAEFQKRTEQIRERLRGIRIPILPICTHEPVTDQVRAALGGR